jgi:PAS domain S-box-containing protein
MDNAISFALGQLIGGLGPKIFESIDTPFGIIDPNFKVVWGNDALATAYNISQKKLLGSICYQAGYNRNEPCPNCHVQAVLKSGKTQVVEKYIELKDGKNVWGEIQAYPVRGESGDIALVIVFGIDITERKKRVKDLTNYSKSLSDKISTKNGPKKIQFPGTNITIKVNLSKRETEILRLISEGYTNVQISELLSISPNTVKTHVNGIFNKLGVNDRTNAAVIATRENLV